MRCGTVPSALPYAYRALTLLAAASDKSADKQQASRDRDGWDRMAIFRAYAKVLEPSDPTMRIYEAGLRTCPGQPGLLLADVLRRTAGVYETTASLSPQFRADIREVAELTSDPELLAIADRTEVPVSLSPARPRPADAHCHRNRAPLRGRRGRTGDQGEGASAGSGHDHA
jgi:hypothetical protein